MEISDFKDLIGSLPYKNQSFDIQKKNWKVASQQHIIDEIFSGHDAITISRHELFNAGADIRKFIVMTLMWGYPTKGRGNNIEKMLVEEQFDHLTEVLENFRENDIPLLELEKVIKSVQGLGLSTLSKFIYFLKTKVEGQRALILDLQIIEAINTGRFEELLLLKGATYQNAIRKYLDYLETLNQLAVSFSAEPDQLEMFLFTFGRSLTSINRSTLKDRMRSSEPDFLLVKKQPSLGYLAEELYHSTMDQKEPAEGPTYRDHLLVACKTLIQFRNELFTSILNLAMKGELSDINSVFQPGDIFSFELDHFKGSSDTNLIKLIALYERIDNEIASLANINTIEIAELDW